MNDQKNNIIVFILRLTWYIKRRGYAGTYTARDSAAEETEPECRHGNVVVNFEWLVNGPVNAREWNITEYGRS